MKGKRHTEESKRKMSESKRLTAPTGDKHPNWNGGRYVDSHGYVSLYTGPNSRAYEHRLVMSSHLGRPLRKDEQIHHVNGDKQDNRLENLEIYDASRHSRMHVELKRELRKLIGENLELKRELEILKSDQRLKGK